MGAQLISTDGKITELTVDEYIKAKTRLISELPTQGQRLLALLELFRELKTEGDDEWWLEFQQFLDDTREAPSIDEIDLTDA